MILSSGTSFPALNVVGLFESWLVLLFLSGLWAGFGLGLYDSIGVALSLQSLLARSSILDMYRKREESVSHRVRDW